MSRAYGYGRVSTNEQDLSIAVQAEQCENYYKFKLAPHGVKWGGWFADRATSGRIRWRRRKAASTMLDRLERGDHIIVSKTDRAFRSSLDHHATMELLQEMGVSVHYLDMGIDASTPVGLLLMGILASVAEFERRRVRERTLEAKKEIRKRGFSDTPEPPFGLKNVPVWDKQSKRKRAKLVYDDREMAIIQLLYRLRDLGLTYQEIAECLRQKNIKNRAGNSTWRTDSIYRLLHRVVPAMVKRGTLPPSVLPERLLSQLGTLAIDSSVTHSPLSPVPPEYESLLSELSAAPAPSSPSEPPSA